MSPIAYSIRLLPALAVASLATTALAEPTAEQEQAFVKGCIVSNTKPFEGSGVDLDALCQCSLSYFKDNVSGDDLTAILVMVGDHREGEGPVQTVQRVMGWDVERLKAWVDQYGEMMTTGVTQACDPTQ